MAAETGEMGTAPMPMPRGSPMGMAPMMLWGCDGRPPPPRWVWGRGWNRESM
jgi:hypothetical protein